MVYGINGDNLVETEMHCIKLLGDKLSTRNFDSQINEINARIAVLNKFTELDRPHTHVFTWIWVITVNSIFKVFIQQSLLKIMLI